MALTTVAKKTVSKICAHHVVRKKQWLFPHGFTGPRAAGRKKMMPKKKYKMPKNKENVSGETRNERVQAEEVQDLTCPPKNKIVPGRSVKSI